MKGRDDAPRKRGLLAPAIVAALATAAVAFAGARLTDLGPWYQALQKPSWQPPDWAFPPAWTAIFTASAIAAVLAWRRADTRARRVWLVALFALAGGLNIAWSWLFFTKQRPDYALIEVGLLWLSILLLVVFTGRFAKAASLLLVVYLAWVSFAAALNFTVAGLNGPFS